MVGDRRGWAERGIERTIREAQERGDFDDLPGAGKPLSLGDPHDPDWWVKQLIEREQLSLVDALPPPIRLRREAELMPGSLVDLATETQVREHLADFNARVEQSWRSAGSGAMSPVVAHRVDVERVLQGWRELTAARRATPPPDPAPASRPARRWWPWSRRREARAPRGS